MKKVISLSILGIAFVLGYFFIGNRTAAKPVAPTHKIKVISTFTILTDFIDQVAGDKVDIITLVGPDGDAHTYEPKPSDLKHIQNAQIIFINDLGFETWMPRLMKSAQYKGPVVITTQDIHPRLVMEDTLMQDPHAWNSVANAKIYVHNLLSALVKFDPTNQDVYRQRASAYLEKLSALDVKIRSSIDTIPPSKRKIITGHDAFGYFGNAYGVKFLAPRGISTEAEPKAKDVAKLIEQIRHDKFKTVFIENITNPKLLEQIAQEGGAQVGGVLYSDALSKPMGPAPSYIKMMEHNVSLLIKAMGELE